MHNWKLRVFPITRWVYEIAQLDPELNCMKIHKDKIGNARRSSRIVVLWSFISLFYIHGGMRIGTEEAYQKASEAVVVWGIPVIGITERVFLFFLLIVILYFTINFAFVTIRIHLAANSWLALKEILCISDHDKGYFDASAQLDHANENIARESEFALLMVQHPVMGFLEYLFAPILFPAILSLWAIIVLLVRAFF